MTLHLYIVNKTSGTVTGANVAIIAETKEKAVQMYYGLAEKMPHSVVEYPLRDGLLLMPRGTERFDVLDADEEVPVPAGPLQ
jgi:hypothetical protein